MFFDDKNKYDDKTQTIDFQNDYVLIKIGDIYSNEMTYDYIEKIFFNIDASGYYFRVMSKEQYPFDFKFNTKFRIKNEETLIEKVKNKEIMLEPNFGWNSLGEGVIEYCKMKEKYFLTITRIKDRNTLKKKILDTNLIAVNYGAMDRDYYKIVDDDLKNFNLKEELSLSHNNKDFTKNQQNFGMKGVFILDKSLTFGMGYAMTGAIFPINFPKAIPREISLDIFYSFDENEIKNKIIEILNPSYEMTRMSPV